METKIKSQLDPKEFGLPKRTCIIQDEKDRILIVLDRKSRVVMKDAKNILDKANKIKKIQPNAAIVLQTTAPVCSKSFRFLNDHQIDVISI